MKKETYFRLMFQRINFVKEFILNLFIGSTSFCRLIIEVFIRKNMGRRYFKFSGAIMTAIGLSIAPFLSMILNLFSRYNFGYTFWGIIREYWLWYVFIAVFLYFSYLRYKDIKHIASLFDLEHFSLSSGDILPFYCNLKYKGKTFSVRTIEIFIEPLPFFIGGLFLMIVGQKLLGGLFVFSAIVYCISYARAYSIGDNIILNQIDQIICNKELTQIFQNDKPATRGFRFYGEKPNSKQLRDEILSRIIDDETEFSEVI